MNVCTCHWDQSGEGKIEFNACGARIMWIQKETRRGSGLVSGMGDTSYALEATRAEQRAEQQNRQAANIYTVPVLRMLDIYMCVCVFLRPRALVARNKGGGRRELVPALQPTCCVGTCFGARARRNRPKRSESNRHKKNEREWK